MPRGRLSPWSHNPVNQATMIHAEIDKSQWAPIQREEHKHDFFADWEEHPGSFFHDVGRMLTPVMAKYRRARGGMYIGKLNSDGVPIADYIVTWNRVSVTMTPHGIALNDAKDRGRAFAEYMREEFDPFDMCDYVESFGLDDFLEEYEQPRMSFNTPAEKGAFCRGFKDALRFTID